MNLDARCAHCHRLLYHTLEENVEWCVVCRAAYIRPSIPHTDLMEILANGATHCPNV